MGIYSKCDRYRYWLEKVIDPRKPDPVLFVMFNPSGSLPGENGETTRRLTMPAAGAWAAW